MDPPTSPFRPVEMSCCAARYSVDNRWYRARIKRYSSGKISLFKSRRDKTRRMFQILWSSWFTLIMETTKNERSVNYARWIRPSLVCRLKQFVRHWRSNIRVERGESERNASSSFSFYRSMLIIRVRGRKKPVTNSTKTRCRNRWIFESSHSQRYNGQFDDTNERDASTRSFRPMYFVQMTIDKHTVSGDALFLLALICLRFRMWRKH